MRVGLVCPYSVDVHGGVQNHVLDLAGALEGLGHQVGVLAPGEQAGGLPAYVTTTGRAVPMPYNGSVARVSFGPLVAGRVRRWLSGGRYDVLHIHEPATPSVSVLALWAARAPVVATFHTSQARSLALQTSAATVLRAGLAKIDAHIVVSGEAHRTMARYLDVEARVIPNGVHAGLFREAAQAARRRAEKEPLPPTLAFVGRADEPRKGLAVLLEALPAVLAEHPGLRVRVVGAGARRSLLRGLPPAVAGQVDLLGPLGDREKARVLAEATLAVAPNTHGESFGIVLAEAMAAGTAVVASDLPAFRRVLDGGRRGVLFSVGDPAALADALCGLLGDPDRVRGLVRRAAGAVADLDWAELAPRVAEVYADVASGAAEAAAG